MKKNLILLGILAVLLLGTYVFQELRTSRLFEASLTKDHLISAERIESLSFSDVEAIKKDKQWWSGDQLLSHNSFKQIEKRLTQLKKIKSVEGNRSSYFSNPIEFKVNGETWTIGDMTLDLQGFYFAQGDRIIIAVMEGEGQELSADPEKAMQEKLDDLKKLISQKKSQLAETQLFRFYPNLPVGTVTIEVDGRPGFELDFKKNETLPPPVKGILAHEKLLEKFQSLLTQITIKREVPYSENLKFAKLGSMNFQNEKEKVLWELWLNAENSADSFIIDTQRKKAFQMVGGTLKIFFIQVQDYWDKKVIPPKEFKNFTRLNTTFIQGSKSARVEVINQEPLRFESSKKVDDVKMNILFQYLFNLSEKDQADRVSQLSKSERKEILSGNYLRVEVMDQEILLWRKAQELIVVNLTQGYKCHFLIQDESFRASFEDVLK